MIQVCAWCGSEIGRVASSRVRDDELSHGICHGCFDNIQFQFGAPLGEYLDSLNAPVYVVDGNGVVQAVNRKGREVLGKEAEQIVHRLGGDVFECAHARLPGGCGRTVHCSGCTIRRAVTRTYETGEPQVSVPAVLKHAGLGEPTAINLRITTVKSGEAVLLRIDDMAS